MRLKRPLFLITILKGFWPLAQLAKKVPWVYKYTARMRKFPFVETLVNLSPAEGDLVFYLPKDETIPVNHSLRTHQNLVLPSEIVDHLIDKSNYRFIMGFCLCRYSNNCKEYSHWMGCLFIGDAAKQINPKFGKFVSKETAKKYAKKSREIGLVHMIGRAYPDIAALGVSPGDKLLSICNCCQCCCGLGLFKHMPDGLRKTVGKIPGVRVKVDKDKCVGCGTCLKDVCFIDAIQITDQKAVIDQLHCKACGRCVLLCPQKAIETIITDPKFMEKALKEITSRVIVD